MNADVAWVCNSGSIPDVPLLPTQDTAQSIDTVEVNGVVPSVTFVYMYPHPPSAGRPFPSEVRHGRPGPSQTTWLSPLPGSNVSETGRAVTVADKPPAVTDFARVDHVAGDVQNHVHKFTQVKAWSPN
jgi:hypothetical protein